MPRWVLAAAVFGLICVMVIPAPGIWGVAIGAMCVLVNVVAALIWLLDRVATRVVVWSGARRARRRAVHVGAGMVRKRV